MKKAFLMMATAIAFMACGQKQEKVPAIDLSNLDTTVPPAVDFYQYATGGWQKNNPLKPEFARFGSFDQLRENNVERLNDLFASMTTMKTVKGSVEQKIADLYKQGLDSVRVLLRSRLISTISIQSLTRLGLSNSLPRCTTAARAASSGPMSVLT